MNKIYCVEDDESIRELVLYALKNAGFEAVGFESSDGLNEACVPSLMLLDIMLPGEDGFEILKKYKENPLTKEVPVIMLTSKKTEADKVKALDMGADDYVDKPFGVMELISRVNAIFRRTSQKIDEEGLSLSGISINVPRHQVFAYEEEVKLTPKEFDLLMFLMKNPDIVLNRDKIMNEVWGFDFEGETRTVDVHIRTLRMKLGKLGEKIQTVRGVGYKFGG